MGLVIVLVCVVSAGLCAALAVSERAARVDVVVVEPGRVERGLYIPARRVVSPVPAAGRTDPRRDGETIASTRLAVALFAGAVAFACLVELAVV